MACTVLSGKNLTVLEWLAENGPASEQEVSEGTDMKLHETYRILKNLVRNDLLKTKSDKVTASEVYYPTFKGFLAYFASHIPEHIDFQKIQKYYNNCEGLGRSIKTAQKLYPDEKIFMEWNAIEKWLGKAYSYYHLCLASANTLADIRKIRSDSINPYVAKNKKAAELLSKIEIEILSLVEKDDFWRLNFERSFVLPFVDTLLSNMVINDYIKGKMTGVPSENLYELFENIIDSEIRYAEDRIHRLNLMKRAFLSLFT